MIGNYFRAWHKFGTILLMKDAFMWIISLPRIKVHLFDLPWNWCTKYLVRTTSFCWDFTVYKWFHVNLFIKYFVFHAKSHVINGKLVLFLFLLSCFFIFLHICVLIFLIFAFLTLPRSTGQSETMYCIVVLPFCHRNNKAFLMNFFWFK